MALKVDSRYGLLSKDSFTSANLSCIHVKLTDSALKFIEDSLRLNRYARPTLQIDDDQGIIRIPDGSSHRDFSFTVSPLSGDPNGSFDCIKQSKDSRLETLDTMTQKINVKATDDVYQTTKDKLAVKNEESKKNCAKELDNTKGEIKSKKITKTIRRNDTNHNSTSSSQSNRINISSWSTSSRSPNTQSTITSSSTSISTSDMSPPLQSNISSSSSAQSNYATSVANSRTTAAKKLDKIKRKQQSKKNSAAKEAAEAHNKFNGPSKSEKEKAKAALLSLPLRERIVHLLALKPNLYDTPNLLLKLRSEGSNSSSDYSSAEVNNILDMMASANSKGCWAIRPEYYHEVDPNWSFYSETDKQLVKRNMKKISVKPIVAVPPTSESLKRKYEADSSEDQKFKKERNTSSFRGNEDDYLRYTRVVDSEQRNKYKEEFNNEYQEYRRLYDYMDSITQKFVTLAEKLKSSVPESPEYQKVEKTIKKEYKAVSSNPEYLAKKPRLEYLHKKLAHIKKLVSEYDNSLLD